MADISQINLPDGSSFNVKDATARSDKMDKANPTGTGELSINRKANTTVGNKSSTLGYNCTASGSYSHAEGQGTTASGNYGSHAEGAGTSAVGSYSHAEGQYTVAQGGSSHVEGLSSQTGANAQCAHAEGNTCIANGEASHAEGYITKSPGDYSHSEGRNTEAKGTASHAEGYGTTANHKSQHVFGEYNTLDSSEAAVTEKGNYVEIVGNGTATNARSNARTLDWSGNETLAGGLTASGNVVVKDGNGTAKVTLNSSTGDVSCTSVNGVTPTDVVANPSGSATTDLTKLQVGSSIYSIPQGGGGSGGHTIVDEEGTSLTQRTDLQFNGAYLEDDSVNDATKVNVVREMNMATFEQLSTAEKKGFIFVNDAAGSGTYYKYSTIEQIVGQWVDGSTLYQRTLIHSGTLSSVGDWTVYDDTVSYSALTSVESVRYTTSGEWVPFTQTLYTNPRFSVQDNHKLYYYSAEDISSTYIYITIQYTKYTA